MSLFKFGLIGKTPPGKLKDIFKHLVRAKQKKPDLPEVFRASDAPIPPKKESIETMEAINRFVRDNPRQDMAGGGMLVQPGFGGTRQGYRDDNFVSGYTKKARDLNEIKFQKELKKMLKEVNDLREKGYGNISNIVEKYSDKLGPSRDKTVKYFDKQGNFKGFNWNREQRKIRAAVITEAKELGLVDVPDNMINAIEDYKKLGKEIPRGSIAKIIRKHKVPESQFNKTLNKVGAFIKQKKKFKNKDAKLEFYKKQRADALAKYSSDSFERMTRGSKTIQGGHTGDIYNEFVTTSTKAYTPDIINAQLLKDVDATLKTIGVKRDAALKAKNFAEAERLNVKGMNIAAATKGYKTFKVVQPDGSSSVFGINQLITTDPMDLTGNINVQKLTSGKDKEFETAKKRFKAKQITAEEFETARAKAEKKLFDEGTSKELIKFQKEAAMKNARMSKKQVAQTSAEIAQNLRNLGFKCKFAGSSGGLTRCDDPMSYVDDIKRQEDLLKIQTSKAPQAVKTLNTARKLNAVRSLFTSTLGPGALAFEAVAALPIAYMGYRGGKTPANILADSTFNLIGKSDQRVLLDKAIELGYDTSNIKNVQNIYKKSDEFQKQSARADEFMGPEDLMMYPRMVQKAEEDLLSATQKFLDPLGNVIPEKEAGFDQLAKVKQAVLEDQAKLAAERQSKVGGFLQSPVADYLPGLAGGGIAKLAGVDSGPPPSSGPNSQGLQGLMKRVKNL